MDKRHKYILDVFDSYVNLLKDPFIAVGSSAPKLLAFRLGIPFMNSADLESFIESTQDLSEFKASMSNFLSDSLLRNTNSYIRLAACFCVGTISQMRNSAEKVVTYVPLDIAKKIESVLETEAGNTTAQFDTVLTEAVVFENLADTLDAELFLRDAQTLSTSGEVDTTGTIATFLARVSSCTITDLRTAVAVLRILSSIGRVHSGLHSAEFSTIYAPTLRDIRITNGTLACIPAPTREQLDYYAEPGASPISDRGLHYLGALANFYRWV